MEDLSHQSKKTEIFLSYEERESEQKKKLVYDFMVKIQKKCSLEKIPFDDYREDFRCEDIHIYKITANIS